MSSRNRKSNRNRKSQSTRMHSYEQLEARQMLTVDLGLSFATGAFDNTAPFAAPSVHGAVGPNHFVQVINGVYSVRDADGAELFSSTSQEFFRDIAGADISAGTDIFGDPIQGEIQDARILYDQNSQRFIASAVVAQVNGDALIGNDILIAISRTDNPLDGYRSAQFTGDLGGLQSNRFATLAVDDASVVITTDNTGGGIIDTASVFAIPVADLLTDTPTAANITRFTLDPAMYGSTIQFASDTDGSSSPGGLSYGIGTFDSGTQISLLRYISTGDPMTDILEQSNLTVPEYTAAPDGRQPNAVDDLNNISPAITGSAVEEGDFIWAVHSVEGSNNNSAIRWYQVDRNTFTLANTGLIEDPAADYLYPSIAVNDFGGIAIGFTATSSILPPSGFVQLGFSAHGLQDAPTITFPQAPVMFQQGFANIVNIQDGINPFGEYSSTTFDPDNPFSFYTFQEYVAGNDVWGTAAGQASINDISPTINADAADNTITLRRNAANTSWLEIEIDGTVTDVYEISTLDTLTLNLGDGNDVINIDYTLGQIATEMGIVINGGLGTDEIDLIDVAGHQFDITGDGSGLLDLVNTFTGFEILTGSSAADSFSSMNSASDWELNGEGSDDSFTIANSSTGSYILRGSTGDDTYGVPILNFPMITIVDSIGSENDTLIGLGTIFDDVVTVNNDEITLNGDLVSFMSFPGIESLSLNGVDGNDTFQIQAINAATTIFGGAGNDLFNISADAPGDNGPLTTIQDKLSIDGGLGTNRIHVSNRLGLPSNITITSDEIIGLTTQSIDYTGNFGTLDGLQGIIVRGSDLGSDVFDIRNILVNNSVLAIGGAGNDTFNVRNNTIGDVVLDGENGSDTFRTTFGETNRRVEVHDTGDDDRRDRFSIRSTNDADDLTINNNSFGAFGEMFAWTGVENLVVDSRDGSDIVTVNRNETPFIRVVLNVGDDVGNVIGSTGIEALRFDGNEGDDSFFFMSSVDASFVQALGGAGSDTFEVGPESFARSRVDGQEGDDIATVYFASRDNRRVNAKDTGGGDDLLNVMGSPQADRVDIRPRVFDREGEYITYDENNETVNYETLGSNDIANVFGTSASEFFANLGVGNDTVNVFSTSTPLASTRFEFSLASGSDTGNVYRVSENATLEIYGQDGSDNFNVGSTLNTDDGNLNLIRGTLFIGGGTQDAEGADSLQVNDRGNTVVPYNYTITDRRFSHLPGPNNIARPFSSFGYNGMEFVYANGTDERNIFDVTASADTVIRVDGNLHPTAGDILNVFVGGGDSMMFGSPASGFLTFTGGFRNVSFQEIEDVRITTTGGSSLTLGDDDLARDALFEFGPESELQDLVDLTVDLGI